MLTAQAALVGSRAVAQAGFQVGRSRQPTLLESQVWWMATVLVLRKKD